MQTTEREFEVVIWGATGFTGRLVAEEACRHPDLRWAIAGRSEAKLEALRAELGRPELPIVVADSFDRDRLEAMCARTAVVVTTVGPYARFGDELVATCAASGTDYCDLTGEPHWVRRMLDAHEATAQASGARIVHCCGFDSIPSDLGCLLLQQAAHARHGAYCHRVQLVLRNARGGFSGGTVASMFAAAEAIQTDPESRRILGNPYAINPVGERAGPDRNDPLRPTYDRGVGWQGPFVMASVNTRVVRRSHALQGFPWGRDFRYGETVAAGGRGPLALGKALAMSVGLGGLMLGVAFGPTRALLRRLAPQPGEGPGPRERERGFFHLELIGWGTTPQGEPFEQRLQARGQRDPGYGATSRMLLAAALTLARDPLETPGGSWTPATALGAHLVERLRAVEVTFEPTEAGVTGG